MRAFATILLDAYRLLQARALFWIAVAVSIIAALLYLSIGFDENGITLMFGAFKFDVEMAKKGSTGAELIYLGIFRKFIVGLWLTWIATILGLICYAPVFPEFMEEGSAGTTLSKPVSRPALFLFKFVAGLLFVAILVTVFVLIAFFAIRFRLGVWNPTVLWAIPVVLLSFSYLLSVMVWLGIKTRSVMASVLLTLLFWFCCFFVQAAESLTYASAHSEVGMMGEPVTGESREKWRQFHQMAGIPYAAIPKMGATTELLDRWIVLGGGESLAVSEVDAMADGGHVQGFDRETIKEEVARHSPFFVIGTSLAFEAVMLGLGIWSFSRRDF